MPLSVEKQMKWKTIIFCLVQTRTRHPNESTNVSHSKAQFQAKRNLR